MGSNVKDESQPIDFPFKALEYYVNVLGEEKYNVYDGGYNVNDSERVYGLEHAAFARP